MPLSIRPKGSADPYYMPGRDLAYAYPRMVEEIAKRFNTHRWPELEQLVAADGVTFDDLCDALDAYIRFLNEAHRNPAENMTQCLDRSGWLSQPEGAKIAIMAMLGTVCTGQLFSAIRDTSSPDGPRGDIVELMKYQGQAKKWLYAHPWKAQATLLLHRLGRGLSLPVRWWRSRRSESQS